MSTATDLRTSKTTEPPSGHAA